MKFASLLVLAAVAAFPVFADGVVDDAIKLANAGMGEEVIVAWCERQDVAGLTAQDIIRLKEGKVPDRAIATLIRAGGAHRAIGPRYADQAAPQQTVPAAQYSTQPSTTYVASSYAQPVSYVYDSSPVYYSSYSSYPYCYSGYPYYYGSYYPSFGLSFNFGRGYYGGYRGGYYGGYRGGYGYTGGFSGRGGFSSGGFRGGISTGFRGGRH